MIGMKKILQLLMLTFLFSATLYGQNIKVSGVVISAEDNMPIIGASVVVKGNTGIGTVTDFDGKFHLNVPSSAKNLVVSYIGMQTQEVSVKPTMKVVLSATSQQLDEVVVTGYQKIDRKMFTGSASMVKAEDAKVDGVTDVSRMLQGKASGVQVQNVSGTFGAAPKIRVRGASSIYGNSSPLWVVDGVVLEDVVEVSADDLSSGNASTLISSAVAGLNADDIETFQILKDASATALYGARAMAGVVVITTKRGRQGAAKISYTGEFTMRQKPSYSQYNVLDSKEQMGVNLELAEKGYLSHPVISRAKNGGIYFKMYDLINQYTAEDGSFLLGNKDVFMNEYLRGAEARNTDWFDELFRNTLQQNHSVSISAGTEKSSYYASLSYFNDPGWTHSDKVNRFTLNLNGSFNITKQLTFTIGGNLSTRRQKVPGTLERTKNVVEGEYSRDFDINPFSYALNTSRSLDPDEFYQMNYAPFNIKNEMNSNQIDLGMIDTKMQVELNYKPIKGLEFQALGAIRYAKSTQEHKIRDESNMAMAYRAAGDATIRDANNFLFTDLDNPAAEKEVVLPAGGFYNTEDNELLNYYFRVSANYNRIFAENHAFNAMVGEEIKYTDRVNRLSNGYGYLWNLGGVPSTDYRILQQALSGGFDYFGMTPAYDRYVAFFGTATYSYKGTYTLNLTGRMDGSNRMGRSRSSRWLPTWNASASWNIGNEEFMKNQTAFSTLVLRATYGLVATMGPASNSMAIYRNEVTYRPFQSEKESSIYIESLENRDLTWEKQNEFNLGLDFGFLDNRISVSADAYLRKGFDLIGYVRNSGIGGEPIKLGNYANMDTKGIEFTLNTRNIITKDFQWTNNWTFAANKNKITNLQSRSSIIDMVSAEGAPINGMPVRGLYSIPFSRLNDEGLPVFFNEKGEETIDGIYFQERDDVQFLKYEGSIDPKIIGGFENSLAYKGFKLDLYFTYQFGNVIRLNPDFRAEYSDMDALPREFQNRWMMAGDEKVTNVPTIVSKRLAAEYPDIKTAYNSYNYSTERVAKGDFIRLKDITLGYEFKQPWVKKAGLSNLSLRLVASNVWLIYADKKLNGQDPEFFRSGGVAMPMPRQYTLSVRFSL